MRTRLKALILGLTLFAVTVHTFQAAVFSQGTRTLGDFGDARFTNLVLEHIHQSILGHQEWGSPAHFHPVRKTLYYSDTHWGTFVLYVVPRLLGLSMGSSFQVWMAALQALNVVSFFYLLGVVGVRWGLRPFITFFALAGFPMTWKAGIGHLQVLILFPFILSVAFLIGFMLHRRVRDLCLSLVFLAAQHYGYVYLGYLAFFVWTALFLAAWIVPIDPGYRKDVASIVAKQWPKLAATGLVCLCALALLYRPHLDYVSTREMRSMASTRSLSPHIHFWFSAPRDSLFYSWHTLLGDQAHKAESFLFSGWVIWAVGGLAILLYRKSPGSVHVKLACVVLASAVGAALFFTAVGSESSGWSPYLLLAKIAKPLRAFRAVGRVSFLIVILLGVVAAVALQEMTRASSRRRRAWGWALACLLAMDVVAVRQNSYSKDAARERAERLAQAVLSGGRQPVFAYLPHAVGRARAEAHLDAWHAALLTGRRTINGYSSNFPETHAEFAENPTRENLKRLVAEAGLSWDEILVIEAESPR